MERAKTELIPPVATTSREPAEAGYEPPHVAWEEEFEPMMVACSVDPLNPECQH